MKKSDVIVRIIDAEETQLIRFEVLWPHREDVAACTLDIDLGADTIHLGAFVNDKLVSIATFFKMESERLQSKNIHFENPYQLRAMATHPDYVGMGAGASIILFATNLLREKNADVIWCNARAVALGFYSKLGFEMIDEWYDVPIIGAHKLMYNSIT